MKSLGSVIKISTVFLFTLILTSCATRKEKQARLTLVDSLITSDNFKFVARQANPLRVLLIDPRLQQLDGNQYLSVSKDTIKSYLPYFGVAQQAPYGSNDNGISFTSTKFTYDKTATRNGFDISITPKDAMQASRLFLSISESGTATLNVTNNNRDAISFTGTIEKP